MVRQSFKTACWTEWLESKTHHKGNALKKRTKFHGNKKPTHIIMSQYNRENEYILRHVSIKSY